MESSLDLTSLMRFLSPVLVLLLASSAQVQSQETWCGKNYKAGQPIIDPGGAYPVPQESPANDPLLLFRCVPEFRPYIQGDGLKATMLVDLAITHTKMNGTAPLFPQDATMDERNQELSGSEFLVTLSIDDVPLLAAQKMPLGLNQKLAFPLLPIVARNKPHRVTCSAMRLIIPGSQQAMNQLYPPDHRFIAHTSLSYQLPNPNGSMIKIDSETRGLFYFLGQGWSPVIPYGFYTAFDDYLAKNLSILDETQNRLYNLVHPVPSFGNLTALEMVLDRMEELGIWLMYDLRWSYKNATQLIEEVNRIKNRTNLLLWYTADEPDGWGDDPSDVKRAYDLINELDGYHPISLVLNCQDYNFRSYVSGTADIVLQDTYPIGINASYSTVYDTPCTPTFGDCGCDNCVGDGIIEIAGRLDRFRRMLEWEGRTDMPVWSVAQAFGNQSFWSRVPTGREFIAQALTSYIHGSTGLVPWIAPTTEDIVSVSGLLGRTTIAMKMFLLEPGVAFSVPDLGRADPQEGLLANKLQHGNRLVLSNLIHREPRSAVEIPILNGTTLQRGLWELTSIDIAMFLASNLGSEPVSFTLRYDNGRSMEMFQFLCLGAVVTRMSDDEGPIGEWQITFEALGSVALFIL